MRRFTAGANDADTRLSRFVLGVTTGLPGSLLYKGFRTGRIKVNGKKAAADARLRPGDVVELYLNDEFFPEAKASNGGPIQPGDAASHGKAPAAPLPVFRTVYQDAGIAVLYKPAGVLSHRSETGEAGLLDAFTAALEAAGEYRPQAENTFSPALANRLDRGTEGLVLAAKTAPALRAANAAIRLGLVQKTYLCVCVGTPPGGVHRAFLARDRAAKTVMVRTADFAGAKPISTGITVLEEKRDLSLCQVALLTGRTHQIRAHLAFLGAPLAGDAKYGNAEANRRLGLRGQLLCAWQLEFSDPLPPDTPLTPLAGMRFTAEEAAQLPGWWAAYPGRDSKF